MDENKKKIIAIIAAAAVVIALAAAYWFISKTPAKQEEGQTAEESNTLKLFEIKDEDIERLSFSINGEAFSFERREEEVERGEDKKKTIEIVYRSPEHPEALLSQSKIKNMLYDFYEFHASKLISEDMSKMAEYGFGGGGNNTITVRNKNGNETTFTLGDKNPVEDSYYVMMSGEDKIYLMSGYKADSFLNGFSAYRETELGEIDTSTILSFSVTNAGERVIGIRYKNENDKDVVTTDTMTYVMVYPYSGAVRIDPFAKMMEPFGGVSAIDFVSDSLDNLKEYGLDKPLKIVLQDAAKVVHTLYFGGKDEKGNIYTMYNDYSFVFTTSPEMYNAVKDIKPFEYLEKFANIYNIDDVTKVTVTSGSEKYEMEINRKSDKEAYYKINQKDATEDAFKAAYQSVIGLSITSEAESQPKEKPVCKIVFTFKDGSEKVTEIFEYDDRNYGVLKNDGSYSLTLKKNIANMLDILKAFSKKPTVKP